TIKCSPYADLSWDLRNPDLLLLLKTYISCQRYGLDARALATALSWLMELYQNGIISAQDTDGIAMEWGSPEAMPGLARKVSYREGIGDLLAEGLQAAASKIGRGSEEYLLMTKGVPVDTHIPAIKSRGLSWAISPRGEGVQVQPHLDYVAARRYVQASDRASFEQAIERYKERAEQMVGIRDAADPTTTVGKAALVGADEERTAINDMTGVCSWMGSFMGLPVDAESIARAMTTGLGVDITLQTLNEAAARLRHVERAFGVRCGFTRADDTVSKRFRQQLKPGGKEMPELGFTEAELEQMKDDYYQMMGWDVQSGVPARETLERYGLSDVAQRLEGGR
ncbi:aldehyde ferredoxin oxidoreductase C-terminal domain-containing protein, partial [Chloroflexota bacterium]